VSSVDTLDFLCRCVRDPRRVEQLRLTYSQWVRACDQGAELCELNKLRVRFYDLSKGARLPVERFQGNAGSSPATVPRPGNVTVHVSQARVPIEVNLPDVFASVFPDQAKLIAQLGGPTDLAKMVATLFFSLMSLSECCTWKNVLAQMGILYTNCNRAIPDWFSKRASEMFTMLKERLVSERLQGSGSEGVEETPGMLLFGIPFADAVKKSSVLCLLWDFLSSFSIMSVFTLSGVGGDESVVWRWKRKLEANLADKMTIDTLFKRFLKFVQACVEGVQAAWLSGNWRDLFTNRSASDWVETAYCVLDLVAVRADRGRENVGRIFENMKRQGLIPPRISAPLTPAERAAFMRELVGEAKGHTAYLASINALSQMQTISRLTDRLRAEIHSLENNKANGQGRKQPFGLFFYGEPGTGKSRMTSVLFEAMGNSRGLPTGADSIFTVVEDANFYDTFENQWGLVFDDIDQTVAPVAAGVRTHVQHVINLINTKSTELEQADVSAKGKKFANFLAAVFTSNYRFANLEGRTMLPLTFWRRFRMYVEIVVKPEYATKMGALLPEDELEAVVSKQVQAWWQEQEARVASSGVPEISAKHPNFHNNYWIFKVYKYDDSQFRPHQRFTSLPYRLEYEFHERHEFLNHLAKSFNKHIDGQIEDAVTFVGEPVCPFCHLRNSLHPDGQTCHEALQGGFSMSAGNKVRLAYEIVKAEMAFRFVRPVRAWFGGIFQLVEDRLLVLKADEFRLRMRAIEAVRRVDVLPETKIKAFCAAAGVVIVGIGLLVRHYSTPSVENELKQKFQAYVSAEPPRPPFEFNNKEVRYARAPVERAQFLAWPETVGKMDIARFATSKVREICCKTEDGLSVRRMRLVHYSGFVWVTMRHFFLSSPKANVRGEVIDRNFNCWSPGLAPTPDVQFDAIFVGDVVTAAVVPNRDIVLLYIPQLPPIEDGIRRYVPETSMSRVVQSFDEGFLCTSAIQAAKQLKFATAYELYSTANTSIEYKGVRTYDGDCATPMVGVAGAWAFIVGLHAIEVSNYNGGTVYRGEEIVRLELDPVADFLSKDLPFPIKGVRLQSSQANYNAVDVKLTELPPKSSLGAALTYGDIPPMEVLGTIDPPQPLGGMKSKVFRTPMADEFREYEEVFGEVPIFQKPNFKGSMEGGSETGAGARWVDPYVVNLASMRNCQGNLAAWKWAYSDYVSGMERLPGWDQLRPLTDYEVWAGIDGTGIKPMNMKTSVGTPFFVQKTKLVKVDKNAQVVEMNVALKYYNDQILETIKEGYVYSPLCWHSLKDEPISAKKQAAHKIRVFNTVAVAYNALVKKYVAPLVLFMQQHPTFFESACGFNITSRQLDEVIRSMQRFGTDGFTANDYENYDVRQCTVQRLWIAVMWTRMAKLAGYSEEEQKIVFFLTVGLTYTTRVIKNDVFFICFGNASGGFLTFADNSPGNSMTYRYAFRRAQMEGLIREVPFRNAVALWTGGDDNIANTAHEFRVCDTLVLARFMAEVGHVLTDAQKTGLPSQYGTVESATFFKRSFRLVETRLGPVWMAPLDFKSIVKMLTVAVRSSEVSEVDHSCILMSNACREAFLHGREEYEHLRAKCVVAATKMGCLENAFLRLGTFDGFMEEFLSDSFITNVG